MRRTASIGAAVAVLAASLLGGAGPAHADGGTTVATAPVVTYDVHYTGDTAGGPRFWRLPLNPGDLVTVHASGTDFEATGGFDLRSLLGAAGLTGAELARPSWTDGDGKLSYVAT